MREDARFWIERLGLMPHPEGGYYRQTYRSNVVVAREALPQGFSSARRASTAIYFLLADNQFSALHRLRSDEVWHFYAGGPLEVHVIDPQGSYSRLLLGSAPQRQQLFQAVVPAGCWFGSRLQHQNSYALVGCTVAPGFEFDDFEMARRAELTLKYPEHKGLIRELTRD